MLILQVCLKLNLVVVYLLSKEKVRMVLKLPISVELSFVRTFVSLGVFLLRFQLFFAHAPLNFHFLLRLRSVTQKTTTLVGNDGHDDAFESDFKAAPYTMV